MPLSVTRSHTSDILDVPSKTMDCDIRCRHQELLTNISSSIDPESMDCENLVQMMRAPLVNEEGTLNSRRTLLGKLQLLADRGHIKPGDYTFFKDLLRRVGLQNIIELIEKAEEDIAKIKEKYSDRPAKRQKVHDEVQDIYVKQYTFGPDVFPGYNTQCKTVQRICSRYYLLLQKCGLEENINLVSETDRLDCKVKINFVYKSRSNHNQYQSENLEKSILEMMQLGNLHTSLKRMQASRLLEGLNLKHSIEPVILVTFPDDKSQTLALCEEFDIDDISENVGGVFVINSEPGSQPSNRKPFWVFESTDTSLSCDVKNLLARYTLNILYTKCRILMDVLKVVEKTSTTCKNYEQRLEGLKDIDFVSDFTYDPKAMDGNKKEIRGIVSDIKGAFVRSKLEKTAWPAITFPEISKKIAADIILVDHVAGVWNLTSYGQMTIEIDKDITQKEREHTEGRILQIVEKHVQDKDYYCTIPSGTDKIILQMYSDELRNKEHTCSCTLGGFVSMRKTNNDLSEKASGLSLTDTINGDLCALIPNHFAKECVDGNVYTIDRLLGTIISPSDGHLVMAVAKVPKALWRMCDTALYTPDIGKHPGKVKLFDIDTESEHFLSGLQVYKWGATTGLTFGVSVGSFFKPGLMGPSVVIEEQDGTPFSLPGDSGSIVCAHVPDDVNIHVIGMLIGTIETTQGPCSNGKRYIAALMKPGLECLSSLLNARFELCN